MLYVAGPFFNEQQTKILNEVLELLKEEGYKFFSPRDECMFDPKTMTPKQVFDMNLDALKDTTLLLCITDDKDVGTIFEAGYSYAKEIPILYLWYDAPKGATFNIMLAASGSVAMSIYDLKTALIDWATSGQLQLDVYPGGTQIVYE